MISVSVSHEDILSSLNSFAKTYISGLTKYQEKSCPWLLGLCIFLFLHLPENLLQFPRNKNSLFLLSFRDCYMQEEIVTFT